MLKVYNAIKNTHGGQGHRGATRACATFPYALRAQHSKRARAQAQAYA